MQKQGARTAPFSTFSDSAKDLSKTPLGIIALFLVLIYGFACLLIAFGSQHLKEIGDTPLIWFLTLFPCAVLAVFTYLVIHHHWKLYSVAEYRHPTGQVDPNFFGGPVPPASLPRNTTGFAISGNPPDKSASEEISHQIEAEYVKHIQLGYELLHQVQVVKVPDAPGTGLFRVRVWIEGYVDKELDEIVSVTYRVWHDFPKKQIVTLSRDSRFDVWLNVNGEFPILARLELGRGESIWLNRYLDLPGRPEDPDSFEK